MGPRRGGAGPCGQELERPTQDRQAEAEQREEGPRLKAHREAEGFEPIREQVQEGHQGPQSQHSGEQEPHLAQGQEQEQEAQDRRRHVEQMDVPRLGAEHGFIPGPGPGQTLQRRRGPARRPAAFVAVRPRRPRSLEGGVCFDFTGLRPRREAPLQPLADALRPGAQRRGGRRRAIQEEFVPRVHEPQRVALSCRARNERERRRPQYDQGTTQAAEPGKVQEPTHCVSG